MIKINLVGKKKNAKAKKATTSLRVEGMGSGQNVLLAVVLILGMVIAGSWWWSLNGQINDWQTKHAEADKELERLADVRAKGEQYKQQKELLARKIDLITDLKKRQAVPVHILDQVSRNLPDFLWLDQMSASENQITITGKATTYNAVTNFYNNLTRSGYFEAVDLGRTFEASDGVSFSMTCSFAPTSESEPEDEVQS